MTPAATQGTFTDVKTVKTRSVAQIIIEVPIEQINEVLHSLGGYPQPGKEPWVAIARLNVKPETKPEKEKRDWKELSPVEQAGILSASKEFIQFADCETAQEATEYLRKACDIASRKELAFNTTAQTKFKELQARFYDWQKHGEAA